MNGAFLLTRTNHSRDRSGQTYLYPVFSRRAGGLSLGINLNPNNACNWRCVYCQVPSLVRGGAPRIDLVLLEHELSDLLYAIQSGTFYQRYSLPDGQQEIRDIAISGNGEPTSCQEFEAVLSIIEQACTRYALLATVQKRLITNGSLMARPNVQRGLERLAALGGEVWCKWDSATTEGMRRINNTDISAAKMLRHLEMCARLCPTWIQTCLFAIDGQLPNETEQQAYLDMVAATQRWEKPVRGVLLYGLARPSLQPEAARLSNVPLEWMKGMGARIQDLGVSVQINQ